MPDRKSITEGLKKLKIVRKETHDTGDPWPHLEVIRSKVPLNVVTENEPSLRNRRPTNFKLGKRMQYDDLYHRHVQWPQRSKVKFTRPLNAMTENPSYLRNGKAYELQTWYTGGVWWTASPKCAVSSKLKALGGCSSHHLQGAGAYCGGPTTGCTACLVT